MSVDGDVMDMDGDSYEDEWKPWAWPAMYRTGRDLQGASQRVQSARMQKAEKKLMSVRRARLNPMRKARNDDTLRYREQGLNFIRNLIGLPSFAAGGGPAEPNDLSEMVDFVFNELGQDRLFDILQAKLKPKVLHPFERR